MTSLRRSQHPQQNGYFERLLLKSGGTWTWRLFSLLMLVLLAAVLVSRPGFAKASGGARAPAKPALHVVVIGDFYSYGYAHSADPVLRVSVPPTLQALNQIQVANPGIRLNVLFIPVRYATKAWLYQSTNLGTRSSRAPLINAVRNANIVIAGVGATDVGFADWMRTVLFDTSASAKAFPQRIADFDNGSYLQNQTAFLGGIATRVAPSASIVTLGYPRVLLAKLSSGLTWWSPFSWKAISSQQASMSDLLVSALNTATGLATSMTAAKHSGLHFLFADLSSALHVTSPGQSESSPPNNLKQTIIGNSVLPYIDQAVNDELTAKGLQGSQDIPPVTATSRWELTVQVPVNLRVGKHHRSNLGFNTLPGIGPRRCVIRATAGITAVTTTGVCGSGGNGAHRPAHRRAHRPARTPPVIPAPPAPLPKPISPQKAPTPSPRPTPTSPSRAGTTSPVSTPSPATTSTSGLGTTSPGGGGTSGGGTSGGGSASGGGTSGGGTSGGGTSGGGGSGGGGSGGGGTS